MANPSPAERTDHQTTAVLTAKIAPVDKANCASTPAGTDATPNPTRVKQTVASPNSRRRGKLDFIRLLAADLDSYATGDLACERAKRLGKALSPEARCRPRNLGLVQA